MVVCCVCGGGGGGGGGGVGGVWLCGGVGCVCVWWCGSVVVVVDTLVWLLAGKCTMSLRRYLWRIPRQDTGLSP